MSAGRLTEAQIAELQELAAQATPGPYRWERHDMVSDATGNVNEDDPRYCDEAIIVTDSGYYPPHGPDAPYLAALDPQTVLSLLAEVQAWRRDQPQTIACGTCAHWGAVNWCYGPRQGRATVECFCADWTPKEPTA